MRTLTSSSSIPSGMSITSRNALVGCAQTPDEPGKPRQYKKQKPKSLQGANSKKLALFSVGPAFEDPKSSFVWGFGMRRGYLRKTLVRRKGRMNIFSVIAVLMPGKRCS